VRHRAAHAIVEALGAAVAAAALASRADRDAPAIEVVLAAAQAADLALAAAAALDAWTSSSWRSAAHAPRTTGSRWPGPRRRGALAAEPPRADPRNRRCGRAKS